MFLDRVEAGRLLAAKLSVYKNNKAVMVLGVPRGGVEVAYAIAKELKAVLGIAVAKKIAVPVNPELALGAVAFGGIVSLDDGFISGHGIGRNYIESEVKRLSEEIKKKYASYHVRFPDVKNKIVIIVDDGMATGHTVLAAIMAVKEGKPKKVVVAVPVSSAQAAELLRKEADEVVCLSTPEFFMAVGEFYQSFPQLTDEDVISYLKRSKA